MSAHLLITVMVMIIDIYNLYLYFNLYLYLYFQVPLAPQPASTPRGRQPSLTSQMAARALNTSQYRSPFIFVFVFVNFATKWHQLHQLQIWPPDGASCKFGHLVVPVAPNNNLMMRQEGACFAKNLKVPRTN